MIDLADRGGRWVVVIDGGAGSGKTTLAAHLAAAHPQAHLVSLDAFYPGWQGLAAASELVVSEVLRPHQPGYHRWDWTSGSAAEWVSLDPDRPVIVEGCGALTPASAKLCDLAIWVEADAETRRRRALERDGDLFAPHWEEWAAQEARHWERFRPWELADLVVNGTE